MVESYVMVQSCCLPLQKQLCLKSLSSPGRWAGTSPWCSSTARLFTSFLWSFVCLSHFVLPIVVSSLLVPSGNTSSLQVTRGHCFYSQTITSVPSFLLSLHSSVSALCFLSGMPSVKCLSLLPILSHWGPAICLHTANLSVFLSLQSCFPNPAISARVVPPLP